MRRARVIAIAFSALVSASRVQADPDMKQACAFAYEEGQRLQHRGALLDARKQLLVCGGLTCPPVMHSDCERWLSQVEASLSTVVFQLITDTGTDVGGATASVDGGAPIALRGRAIELDPGEHDVRFAAEGYEPRSIHYSFVEGQKLRQETVILKQTRRPEPLPSSPASTPSAHATSASHPATAALSGSPQARPFSNVPFLVAGSVGLAGVAAFTYFGLSARAGDNRLGACSPGCDPHDVDAVRRDYILANVSLGVGAAGIVAAGVLWAVNLHRPSTSSARTLSFGLSSAAPGPQVLLSF